MVGLIISHGMAALIMLVVASPAPELLLFSASSIPSAISDSHPDSSIHVNGQIERERENIKYLLKLIELIEWFGISAYRYETKLN